LAGAADQGLTSEWLMRLRSTIRLALSDIMGLTELTMDTDLTPQQRAYLESSLTSADTLRTVLDGLLDLSEGEADQEELESVAFNLRDGLGYAMGPLALRAHEQGVGVVLHVLRDVPDAVVGSPWTLRQAVTRLVEWAVAQLQQGLVLVRVTYDEEQAAHPADTVWLRVSVTLSGTDRSPHALPPQPAAAGSASRRYDAAAAADREALGCTREPHAGPATSGASPGTALALAVAVRLVARMGGRLWGEPSSRSGSTVCFTAPFGVRGRPVAAPAPAEPEAVHGLRALVAVGHRTTRRLLRTMLANWHLVPMEADSAEAALQQFAHAQARGAPMTLVMLDTTLPDLDAFTLARRLTAQAGQAAPTLILLTAAGHRGDARRCKEAGISAYLLLPVTQADLFDAVMLALGAGSAAEGPLLVTRHTLRERRRLLRVLLVDDDRVNETVARHVLEQVGHTVVVARGAAEALQALRRTAFDLTLLDLHELGPDSHAVMAAVREQPHPERGRSQLVALHAHPEDHCPECTAADGALAKPLRARALLRVIETLAHPAAAARSVDAADAADEPFDRQAVLAQVEGDARLLLKLTDAFQREAPRWLAAARQALTQRDGEALAVAARKLRGCLAALSAQAACEHARRLEALGEAGELTEAAAVYDALAAAWERLRAAVATVKSREALGRNWR
jgi:CheY-like chemotaxis protein